MTESSAARRPRRFARTLRRRPVAARATARHVPSASSCTPRSARSSRRARRSTTCPRTGATAMRRDLEKIATYSAALVQDEWASARRLGQTPVVHERTAITAPVEPRGGAALASKKGAPPADEFSPRAASNVATITRDTLNAIAFPTFVADLIKGTFQAIVNASIQQMEAYGQLLANVAKTVDQFMADNITDNNARDYLAATYPGHFKVETSRRGRQGGRPRQRRRPAQARLQVAVRPQRGRRSRRRRSRGDAGAGGARDRSRAAATRCSRPWC